MSKEAKQFCMVELKAPVFQLFFDLDINDKINSETGEHSNIYKWFFVVNKIDIHEFWRYMIKLINKTLKYYINGITKDQLLYIYSDRTDKDYKVHIYYPNINVNKQIATQIRDKLLNIILDKNKYGLTDILLNDLIDPRVYTDTGLRLMFQRKTVTSRQEYITPTDI